MAKKIIEADKSTTLIYDNGDLKYHDNYFGGEPYAGREVVFFKSEPIYIMTYYGLVDDSIVDFKPVYKFLQSVLLLVPEAYPFRGPNEHINAKYSYKNSFNGEINCFFGEETISSSQGKEIYIAKYIGGYICQR